MEINYSPYQKYSNSLSPKECKTCILDTSLIGHVYAVRMFAMCSYASENRRFLINSVTSDGNRVPIASSTSQLDDHFGPVFSDIYFRCDSPLLVKWGNPLKGVEVEIENIYEDSIETTIVLYGQPMMMVGKNLANAE